MDFPRDYPEFARLVRFIVTGCSALEILLSFSGLNEVSSLRSILYIVLAAASLAVTIHNLAHNIDGIHELNSVVSDPNKDFRKRAAALVLVPPSTALLLFLFVSNNGLFSLTAFVHMVAAVAQLGYEVYLFKNNNGKNNFTVPKQTGPVSSRDPNYETLARVNDQIFLNK
ncbi:unnamed protein product [Caenorhabditis auriculariae]|uniref:DUF7087 domain-containing protein n=1 Tax=Caenorhabditis auriculariae TaxID=2777116 RepID=A0A8S1HMK1_9PELO|nr:unnamed protein product [Caenorhabditis auriculariae]